MFLLCRIVGKYKDEICWGFRGFLMGIQGGGNVFVGYLL